MTWWQALILGTLQGLTEFLPVSSSGHLALSQMAFVWLGTPFSQPGVAFDAILHVATSVAIVWSERRQLSRWFGCGDGPRLLLLLTVGTLATAAVAFPLRGVAKAAFENVTVVAVCLLITAVLVLSTRWLGRGHTTEATTSWRQAVAIGLVQGLAVFPGISRSGATIAAGLGAGLDRKWVARFSFLLSVPAIAGVTLVELITEREALVAAGDSFWLYAALGGFAAAATGLIAIRLVIRLVNSQRFHYFAWYCAALGILVLVAGWVVAP